MIIRIIFFALLAATLAAQSPQATISGVINDPQNALIPNVEVVATEIETGGKTITRTNGAGFYSLRNLPIGNYTITAHLEGFRSHRREGIGLTTGQALELDFMLELGAVTETVSVSA